MKDKKAYKGWTKLGFVLASAGVLALALLIVVLVEFLILAVGIVGKDEILNSGVFWVLIFALLSMIIGFTLAGVFGRVFVKPFNKIITGLHKLSDGDFSCRLELGKKGVMKEFSDTFNTLASELERTEILRSDFVNGFSHELKTPIASVSSLVHLLKNEDLPKEKRQKYLEVIEEEINRISGMTTNILNLSKIETQSILTDTAKINVSEQIRTCVLMLEKLWEKKNLNLIIDFDEHYATINEDMFKQVWLNLLDNAIKFSDPNTDLKIEISSAGNEVAVGITNHGVTIDKEDYDKIFQKFYRADKIKKDGNGIGLSIVKHIVDLHGGKIAVNSEKGETTFTVRILKKIG